MGEPVGGPGLFGVVFVCQASIFQSSVWVDVSVSVSVRSRFSGARQECEHVGAEPINELEKFNILNLL